MARLLSLVGGDRDRDPGPIITFVIFEKWPCRRRLTNDTWPLSGTAGAEAVGR
jgi:hypothetical protein